MLTEGENNLHGYYITQRSTRIEKLDRGFCWDLGLLVDCVGI